jgi:hypothetical protein
MLGSGAVGTPASPNEDSRTLVGTARLGQLACIFFNWVMSCVCYLSLTQSLSISLWISLYIPLSLYIYICVAFASCLVVVPSDAKCDLMFYDDLKFKQCTMRLNTPELLRCIDGGIKLRLGMRHYHLRWPFYVCTIPQLPRLIVCVLHLHVHMLHHLSDCSRICFIRFIT